MSLFSTCNERARDIFSLAIYMAKSTKRTTEIQNHAKRELTCVRPRWKLFGYTFLVQGTCKRLLTVLFFYDFYFRFARAPRVRRHGRARARAAHDLTSRRQVAHSTAAVCVHKSRSPAAAAAAAAPSLGTRTRALEPPVRAYRKTNVHTGRLVRLVRIEFRVFSSSPPIHQSFYGRKSGDHRHKHGGG